MSAKALKLVQPKFFCFKKKLSVIIPFLTDIGKTDDEIIADVIKHVRDGIGPVASFKQVVLVPKLPKTRSGKIARNTIAAMAAGKPFKVSIL